MFALHTASCRTAHRNAQPPIDTVAPDLIRTLSLKRGQSFREKHSPVITRSGDAILMHSKAS